MEDVIVLAELAPEMPVRGAERSRALLVQQRDGAGWTPET